MTKEREPEGDNVVSLRNFRERRRVKPAPDGVRDDHSRGYSKERTDTTDAGAGADLRDAVIALTDNAITVLQEFLGDYNQYTSMSAVTQLYNIVDAVPTLLALKKSQIVSDVLRQRLADLMKDGVQGLANKDAIKRQRWAQDVKDVLVAIKEETLKLQHVERGGNQDLMRRAQEDADASATAAEDVLRTIKNYVGDAYGENVVSMVERDPQELLCRSLQRLAESLGDVLSKASDYDVTVRHLPLGDRIKERLPQWLQRKIGYDALTLSTQETRTIMAQLDTLADGLTQLLTFLDADEQYSVAMKWRDIIGQLQRNMPRTPGQEWYDDAQRVARGVQYFLMK